MYLTLIACVCIAYGLILAIYRVTLHPLAKYPGPKLGAITYWWEFFEDVFREGGGKFHFRLDRLHDRYGPVVRVTPGEIHVKDSKWMDVLFAGPGHKRDKDPSIAYVAGTKLGTFGTVDHSLHRKRRAAISPLFSKRSISILSPQIQQNVEALCARLDESATSGQVVNLRVTCFAWAFDFMTSYIFFQSLGLLKNDDRAEQWYQIYYKLNYFFPYLKQAPWLIDLGLRLPLSIARMIAPDLAPFIAVYKDIHRISFEARKEYDADAKSKEEAAYERPNLYNYILDSDSLSGTDKNPTRIANEAFELLIAGGNTLARITAAASYHLLSSPQWSEKLDIELRAAIPNASVLPPLNQLEQLPYLTAVLQETLRLTPLIFSRMPLIATEETLEYGEWTIPAGTTVSMTTANASMDASIFPEPNMWEPARWLESEERTVELSRHFAPFGKGNRKCLGMDFAWAQMYLGLAAMFRRYKMTLYDTERSRDVDHTWGGFVGEPATNSKGIRVLINKSDSQVGI